MTDKEKRQKRHSEEDAVFNRLLLWLAGVVVAEAIVLFVKRFYINVTGSELDIAMFSGLGTFFSVFMYAGLVLTVLGVVWCCINLKKHKGIRLPGILTAAVAFVWIVSLITQILGENGVQIMMLLPIVAAVLILIYFLYQRAFFVNAIIAGCGMAGLWCFREYFDSHAALVIVLLVLGWLVLAAISILAYLTRKNGGKLGKFLVVEDKKSYVACWLTCAIVFISTVLSLILGASFAFYLIYALIGWLFCLAVYYTVKLI